MPAEELSPVDQDSSGDRERESHRRSGGLQFVHAVTFGLGVAALAGVVITTGAVTSSDASVNAVSGHVATAVALDPAIHQLIGGLHTSCTGQS